MKGHEVKSLVYTALQNAKDNGYDMAKQPVGNIVLDLQEYDADLQDVKTHLIEPHVVTWIREQQGSGT